MYKVIGFSLIELMITVAIIGILSAIALPLYSEHIIHARRLTAEMNLLKLANALEKYNILNETYENATLVNLGFNENVEQYRLRIASTTATNYLLTATPLKDDSLCGTLSLDSVGNKNISGSGSIDECW